MDAPKRLTREMLWEAIETLKRNCAAASTGKYKCDICGKKIYGYYGLLDLPGKQGAIIHATGPGDPCFAKALEAIRKATPGAR